MLSIRISATLVAMAMFSLNAQAQYAIDPNSVPISTRQNWCQSQMAACPLLCLQNTKANDSTTAANDCDATTLNYHCICGNGITPDIGNYSQTIPFFLCQEYGNQCVAACANGDTPCQSACRDDNPCGAQNPTRVNTTSSSTMAATATGTSSAGGAVYTGLGTDSTKNNKKNGSQATLDLGRSYGLAVVFAGLFAGFALVL